MKKKAVKTAKKKAAKKAVKKTAKKAVTKAKKKTPAKPKVEVTIKRKITGRAPEEYHFVLQDGRKLESVYELIDELETMHEDLWKHHVNEMKNDFANWIEHVFEDKNLAEDLREMEHKMDAQRALLKELVRALVEEKK